MSSNKVTLKTQRSVGVILSYLYLGVSTLISIIYTPFMLHELGQSDYGLYQLIGSLAQYLSLLSLGLSGSYIRFFTKYKADKGDAGVQKLNGMYLSTFILISCIAIICGLVITINLESFFDSTMTTQEISTGSIMMLLMTVNAAITLPMTIFTSYISANERFIFQRAVKLVYGICNPILCAIALFNGGKVEVLVIIALVSTILMTLSEVFYCVRNLKFRATFKHIKFKDFSEIFSFSFFVLINDIINQVNWSIDKVILGVFSGTAAIAIYGIAAQLNMYYLSISTAISSVYTPEVNRIVAGKDANEIKDLQLSEVFMQVGRKQSMIIFLIITGYVFFGQAFIKLWAGANYTQSYYVGLWLMIPAAIPLLQNVGIEIQRAKNKQKTRTIVYAAIAVGNVVVSIPLCKIYGAVGCAIGTAFSLILGNILFMNWYYYKRLNINIVLFWKSIFSLIPAMFLPLIVGFIIWKNVVIHGYLMLVAFMGIYTTIYGISVFMLGLHKNERKKAIQLAKRLISKIAKRG